MNKNKQTGFALIEVMVAALVFSIATVGYMKLQSRSLSDSYENYANQQARSIVSDFIEKIRANPAYRFTQPFTQGGILSLANNSPAGSCSGNICQGGQFSYQAREIATNMGAVFPANLSVLCYFASPADSNEIRIEFIWRGKSDTAPNNNLITNLDICPTTYAGNNPNLTPADRAVTVYARI